MFNKYLVVTALLCLVGPHFSLEASASDPAKLVPGFARVDVGVYRGGRPDIDGLAALADVKIRTIVDLQGGDLNIPFLGSFISTWEPGEDPAVIAALKKNSNALGMDFINYPLRSIGDVSKWDDNLINHALILMHKKEAQPVYVHCEFGRDRTGLLIALYRVKYSHWPVEAAYQEWMDLGHDGVHRLFTQDLDEYFYWKVKQL